MLPADWRARMTEVIRGAEEPDATWFNGGPFLTPREQIEVYRRQYRLRLGDAVVADLKGLEALLGYDATYELALAFLVDHPSQSFTLNRVAYAFPDWLAGREAPAVQVEMAQLDIAVQMGFEAPWGRPITPEELAGMPQLGLQAHVTLLRPTHSVQRFRSKAVGADAKPPAIEEGDFPLVVYRKHIRMRHLELDVGAWEILTGIGEGLSIGDAIERAVARGVEAETLVTRLQGWFATFAKYELVEVRS